MTRAVGLLALGVALFAAPSWCGAQRVQDLTGQGLTADSLEKVLTPYSHSRGISLRPPDCAHFREASSRGIELVPKADIAAITVQFASNSAALTPDAKKTLDTLGEALNSADLKPCCFEIEGHTDNVGNSSYNLKLSKRRAQSVIDYLVEHAGQDEHRMLAAGFGPSKPLADNQTDQGRAKNRRVQVVNLGYGSSGE
jgi:OmpA-OmpF porin, OOP family